MTASGYSSGRYDKWLRIKVFLVSQAVLVVAQNSPLSLYLILSTVKPSMSHYRVHLKP